MNIEDEKQLLEKKCSKDWSCKKLNLKKKQCVQNKLMKNNADLKKLKETI